MDISWFLCLRHRPSLLLLILHSCISSILASFFGVSSSPCDQMIELRDESWEEKIFRWVKLIGTYLLLPLLTSANKRNWSIKHGRKSSYLGQNHTIPGRDKHVRASNTMTFTQADTISVVNRNHTSWSCRQIIISTWNHGQKVNYAILALLLWGYQHSQCFHLDLGLELTVI